MTKKLWPVMSLVAIAALILAACGPAATAVPTQAPQATQAPAATQAPEPAAGGLTGEVTMWHAYGTGSAEETAITQVVEGIKAKNPDLTVNVLQIPFDQVFNKWETEVAAGGGPDLFTAPNDNLGNQIRAGLVADVTSLLTGKLNGFSKLAIDGVSLDGKIYAVPGIVKAVALYYNKDTVATPPATTDALLDLVESGKKLVINQNVYHNFPFWGSFGGKLLAADGTCIADQGGFAEAMQYLLDLKAAGASFETDGGKADTLFRQGQADMIINGPWVLGDYSQDVANVGVVPVPAGPGGPSTPLSGIDGWYINPNASDAQKQLAVDFALEVLNAENQAIYADVAGAPPSRTDVKMANPLVAAFAQAGAAGFPRPQSAEFGNYWGPFGDMLTKVMEGKAAPEAGVAEACAAMNKANNK
jgi:arabinogalactan oligomer/maltooligosaccharide transport system substrate-binding protein